MSKIKNVSGTDLIVPWLGGRLVAAGQVVEVPADDVYAYTQQSGTWEPVDEDATAAHRIHDNPDPADDLPPVVARPAGNAPREEWVAYAVASGHAPSPESLDGIGRDEIRDSMKES